MTNARLWIAVCFVVGAAAAACAIPENGGSPSGAGASGGSRGASPTAPRASGSIPPAPNGSSGSGGARVSFKLQRVK